MNTIKKNSQDYLEILIKISKKSEISQRKLAEELGFSLGKLNYCINELHKKGLIKIKNFNKNKKKSNYLYFLTPQGIASKTKLVDAPVLQAEPPLTRMPAASNKSITSLLVKSFTAKLSVVGTL